MRIANTPAPLYYSVTTTAIFNDDIVDYQETGLALFELAEGIEGFLGLETCLQKNCGIAVSYWNSLDAIKAWKFNEAHVIAKQTAKKQWFSSYVTRIAKVDWVY